MAIGTGNLPYPGKVYNPFDILTAEELNEDVANIESLADGSGLGDGSVGADKLGIGDVVMPSVSAVNSLTITVTNRSMIHAYSVGRLTSGTATNYRIVATAVSGTILRQRTTSTSNAGTDKTMSATAFILVEPGTYTLVRPTTGGGHDQNSLVATAIPAPYNLAT